MRDEQDRFSVRRPELQQLVFHQLARLDVERRKRLVHQDDLGIEDQRLGKRRIDEASKYIAVDHLCLSPQCGFSSTHHGNNLSEAQEVAKLKLCTDTAKEVWGSL